MIILIMGSTKFILGVNAMLQSDFPMKVKVKLKKKDRWIKKLAQGETPYHCWLQRAVQSGT